MNGYELDEASTIELVNASSVSTGNVLTFEGKKITYDVAPLGTCRVPLAWFERFGSDNAPHIRTPSVLERELPDLVLPSDPRVGWAQAAVAAGAKYPRNHR